MAEEEEVSALSNIGSGRSAREWLDPENGLAGVAILLQETAAKTLEEHFLEVVTCIMDNIRAKHLPSVKLLMDLAGRVRREEDVPAEAFESFAETLWKAWKEQQVVEDGEQGTGNPVFQVEAPG